MGTNNIHEQINTETSSGGYKQWRQMGPYYYSLPPCYNYGMDSNGSTVNGERWGENVTSCRILWIFGVKRFQRELIENGGMKNNKKIKKIKKLFCQIYMKTLHINCHTIIIIYL